MNGETLRQVYCSFMLDNHGVARSEWQVLSAEEKSAWNCMADLFVNAHPGSKVNVYNH